MNRQMLARIIERHAGTGSLHHCGQCRKEFATAAEWADHVVNAIYPSRNVAGTVESTNVVDSVRSAMFAVKGYSMMLNRAETDSGAEA